MRYTLIIISMAFMLSCNSENGAQATNENLNYERIDTFTQLDSLSLAVENTIFSSETTLQNITTKETASLDDLDLRNSIILYLSEIQCSTCIDQELELLKAHYKNSQVFLLCNYRSMRDLKLYFLINKIEFPAYLIRSEIPKLISSLTNPTYFRLGSDFRPSSVFFASFTAKKKSEAFHETMSDLLVPD